MSRTPHLWKHLNTSSTKSFQTIVLLLLSLSTHVQRPFLRHRMSYGAIKIVLLLLSTRKYKSSVGVQHWHNKIYKLRGSTAWKHTFTLDIQAPWESSMETYIHTREYTQRRRLGPDFGGEQVEDN